MIAIVMLVVWGGYGLTTWGWILVKGYDVSFAQWFNPVKRFEWPQGKPPMIPANQIFPGSVAGQQAVTPSPGVSRTGGSPAGQLGEPGTPGVPKGWPTQGGFPIPVRGKCPPGWFNRSGQCDYAVGF